MGAGLVAFLIIQTIRIQFFAEYTYILYGLLLLALGATYFMPAISGAHRWLNLGPISIQPSELGKIIVVFTLAKYLADRHENSNAWVVIGMAMFLAIIPALMVFRQPDLGTAVIYMAVTLPMLYWSGVRSYYLFVIMAPLISILAAFHLVSFYIWIAILILVLFLSQPRLWVGILLVFINLGFGTLTSLLWNNLYPHQKQRILTFLDPMQDPQGAGYQIIQSITAIGSGGVLGKGLGEGTQTHLRFLPVRDTDFIVSVIGEELGLLGILVVIAAYFYLVFWKVTYAEIVHNRFAGLCMIGFSALLLVHATINMGMTAGLFPVTGLPAPFISYGGSFLLTVIITVALANNIVSNNV